MSQKQRTRIMELWKTNEDKPVNKLKHWTKQRNRTLDGEYKKTKIGNWSFEGISESWKT